MTVELEGACSLTRDRVCNSIASFDRRWDVRDDRMHAETTIVVASLLC